MKTQPASIEDIKELLKLIEQRLDRIENNVRELHHKFDTLNHKTGKHSGILWIFGIALAIIFTGVVNLAVSMALNL